MAELEKKKDHYRALTLNMVLFVVGVSVIPLLLTGLLTLSQFSETYGTKVREHLRELVQKHSQNIDSFLNSRLGEIKVLARSDSLDQLSDQTFLTEKLALFREEYGGVFVDLGVVRQDGSQVAYAGPFNLLGADYAGAHWFKEALKYDYYISDVFAGLRGTPHFIIAVGRTSGRERFIIKATINFQAFNALVENIRVGDTGFAFIINQRGSFQTKPRYDVDVEKGPFADLLDGRLNPGQIPVITRPDPAGRKAIYALAPLKGGEWVLCLKQTASDAYSYMYDTVKLAVAVIVVFGVAIVIVAFFLSRNLVNRIRNLDQERAIIKEKVIETGRLASLGELAAGIAHEINNPVAIMVEEAGWIEDILAKDEPISEEDLGEIQRAVQMVRTQGDRCKEITYKLLSFARKTDPTIKTVNLNTLVEEVMGLLQQKSRFASVQIETDLDQTLPEVSASPSEMQQVLLNLMNNAVDAMDKQGGVIKVASRRENGNIILSVADTGTGIPEANLARVFDPFFTTKPVGKGTGLGLSIVYGIVEKMGGHIAVKSAVGRGTTFTVTLPAGKVAEDLPGPAEAGSESAQE